MQEHMMESISQHVCPMCQKQFTVLWPLQWGYKRREGNNRKFFCSWSCIRKYDKGDEKKMGGNTKVTEAQKLEAIRIAIDGGDPREHLAKLGSKNPNAMWSQIRMWCNGEHPELAEKLPRVIGHKKKPKKTAADAMEGMQEAADEFFGQCEDMGLKTEVPEEPKIYEPVNYDGMTVREVEGLFGRFRRSDVGVATYIDYEPTEGCDTISFTVDQWRKFAQELDKAAQILGVEL